MSESIYVQQTESMPDYLSKTYEQVHFDRDENGNSHIYGIKELSEDELLKEWEYEPRGQSPEVTALNERVAQLEQQLDQERQQHYQEISELKKQHEQDMAELKQQLESLTQDFKELKAAMEGKSAPTQPPSGPEQKKPVTTPDEEVKAKDSPVSFIWEDNSNATVKVDGNLQPGWKVVGQPNEDGSLNVEFETSPGQKISKKVQPDELDQWEWESMSEDQRKEILAQADESEPSVVQHKWEKDQMVTILSTEDGRPVKKKYKITKADIENDKYTLSRIYRPGPDGPVDEADYSASELDEMQAEIAKIDGQDPAADIAISSSSQEEPPSKKISRIDKVRYAPAAAMNKLTGGSKESVIQETKTSSKRKYGALALIGAGVVGAVVWELFEHKVWGHSPSRAIRESLPNGTVPVPKPDVSIIHSNTSDIYSHTSISGGGWDYIPPKGETVSNLQFYNDGAGNHAFALDLPNGYTMPGRPGNYSLVSPDGKTIVNHLNWKGSGPVSKEVKEQILKKLPSAKFKLGHLYYNDHDGGPGPSGLVKHYVSSIRF